ncbi:penicillin-binding transpeptidase domain-containing protein [Actinoplanes sp. KI2]|uniref:penicillin-binding transpeptidase domain-containing protein n=1 Tax=Actinoplanes sp. KI2 TaxID=2983315 RepID=UPI0021D6056A|nr:penicillin-binding transpeptidase domain-containing protein [Actinoplanes sp. KI2]MCU7723552.1 penicillin-binding transpeptidase domain-containing protein [Actinoplanes sp. KI2]
MPPRNDDTPRRGEQPRRGTSRDLPAEEGTEETARGRGGFGIGDARAYTPRGRTLAERDQRTRSPRAGRNTDPFRPALQVLDGGRPQRGRRPAETETPATDEAGRREQRDPRREPPRSRRPEPVDDDRDELEQRRQRAAGRDRGAGQDRAPGRGVRVREGVRGASAKSTRETRASYAPRTRKGNDKPAARTTAKGRGRPVPKGRAVPEPPKLANPTRRLRLGTVLALSLFVMIGVRLVVLQVAASPADAARLIKLREDRISEITLPASRGSILDRNGTVLAHSVEARYVAADPVLVKNVATEAAILAPLLGVPASKLIPKMTKHARPGGGQSRFEFLAQGVDIAVGDKIAAMNLGGIVVRQDERRDEPGADLAANLIGFTGADNSGLEGIEGRYDSLLRGTPGSQEFEIGKGDLNAPIPGGFQRYVEPQPGTSIELTIDAELQWEVQHILGDQLRQWKASIGGAVVLDIKTGEVLAQASFPPYNAQKPLESSAADRDDVPSSIVADPGSVHKPFMFGAALQEGLITPDSTLAIGPALRRGGYTFPDSHPQPKGTLMTMPGLLALSSDVGTILIGDKLGKQRVYEYQQKFGLGRSTNEGVAGEAQGKILPPDEWSGSASGSVPIGHSVDATLIQMAAGYAAIANNGTYIQPHIIKSYISGKDGKVTSAGEPATHQVLSPNIAAELRTMMEAVVDNADATGTQARVNGYRVAGKTGTGKRLVDGQYTSSNYGSFIGMAPAENPRFVIAVSAEVPHGTGGEVAAPAFSKMMSYALLQNRVPPSATKPPTFRIHP